MSVDSKDTTVPKASHGLVVGGMLVYVGGLFLTVSFFSPYWLSSYDESFSTFKNMGIWEYCFENFRYPNYQYDEVFDGCRSILSDEYHVLREWLLPGWLLALECFITFGLILSLTTQLILASIVIRYPQELVLKYEYLLVGGCLIQSAVTSFSILMAICIFPLNCWRRDWLMYPMYNHLSWAYYSLFFALLFHVIGARYLHKESKYSYEKRNENRSLVMQMYPEHSRNGFF